MSPVVVEVLCFEVFDVFSKAGSLVDQAILKLVISFFLPYKC